MSTFDDDWKFIKEIQNIKVDSTTPSWQNTNKIEAFKNYTTSIGKFFEIPLKVTFKTLQNAQSGEYAIQVSATCSYGTLSTNLPYAMILSPNCSKNLPETLLQGFVNSFKLKIEREKKQILKFSDEEPKKIVQTPVAKVEEPTTVVPKEEKKKNGRKSTK